MKMIEEKVLKYEFRDSLSNEVLNEIIKKFDKAYDSLQNKELGVSPSKFSFKNPTTGETTILGRNYLTEEVGLLKYPQDNSYLISKGHNSREIIEKVLNSHKITNYNANLTEI
jgi:hypothetical protein